MKNFKFLVVVALLAIATSASAQFTNSKSSSSTDDWNTVWVEWNPSTLKVDVKGADNESFTGFSLGYSHAFGLTKSIPLFAEVGLGVQYSFKTMDSFMGYDLDDDEELKMNLFSAKVPVNLIYAFQIPNSSVSILPFVGVNLRYNISGKAKYSYDDGYDSEEEDFNLFDKDDMDELDMDAWKRFQIGWHIGVKARFADKFLVGVSYGSDFSEIAKKMKVATGSISLGYTF